MFKKSLIVATALSAIAFSTQAAADDVTKLTERVDKISGFITDINRELNESQLDIDTHKRYIKENQKAIASNTETIKQHYAEMKNNFAAVNSRLDNLDEEMKKGFASQAALTGLFQPYNVGKFNLSVALGGYESEQAMALGTGYRFNENFAMKAGVASDVGGFDHITYNIGANFEW